MKTTLKRIITLFMTAVLMVSFAQPAFAMSSSLRKKTGHNPGDVLQKTYSYNGGRNRGKVLIGKDVYVSERVITDKFVKNVTEWNATDSVTSLSYNKSNTISATGSVDIIRVLGLKTSVTTGASSSAGGAHKPDPSKGKMACLAIKCDYIEVTYRHFTYSRTGKQTGVTTKTVLTPIANTAVYYVRYAN